MAGFDAEVSTYFQKYVVPVAALLIGLRMLYFILGKIYPIVYVFMCESISAAHHKAIRRHKELLFSDIGSLREENKRFSALEIGCGPGRNFAIYPSNTSLIVVEPKLKFHSIIARNAAKYPTVEVAKFVDAGAENLREHVGDDSQDAVVCTFSLCSVQNPEAVVREARRVLKPGGRFYFMEHTRAHTRNGWTHLLQCLFAPLFYLLAGCMLCQTPWVTIDRAGFSKVQYTKTDLNLWRIIKPHFFGYAEK